MRPIQIGKPPQVDPHDPFQRWVMDCFAEIERAAEEDVSRICRDFTLTGVTDTRTFDASTATLADVRNVLGTLIQDIGRRGMKRSQ